MKLKKKIILLCITLIVLILAFTMYMIIALSGSSNPRIVDFTINDGESKTQITKNLQEAGIIKSALAANIYIMLTGNKPLYAGSYKVNNGDETFKIIKKLQENKQSDNTVTVLFYEGSRLTDIATIISENFGYTYNEVIDTMNNKEFLKTLINKYEYLTDEILNEDIYYPLEGYLAADTYEFYKDASIEEIVETLIEHRFEKLKNININNSKYTFHDIITIASIVDLEANSKDDRYNVAGVIYNRLDINMTLGMDVTTYYATQKKMGDHLLVSELNDLNAYNTRASNFHGLPVGPICNPSLESINAALNPNKNKNIYFYADETGKVHFFKKYNDFLVFKNAQ